MTSRISEDNTQLSGSNTLWPTGRGLFIRFYPTTAQLLGPSLRSARHDLFMLYAGLPRLQSGSGWR